MVTKYKEELRVITEAFLAKEIDYLDLSNATKAYKNFLSKLSIFKLEDEGARKDLFLDSGVAIGTTWAAMCIDDFMRTKRFIQGVFQAIEDLRATKTGTLHVFYAGTGPYATLILPLLTHYSPEDIQFSLLEINPISFNNVKNVIENLECNEYVREFIKADATKYQFDEEVEVDLMVSETMLKGLRREQQVPIVINLMQQLPETTLLIPQRIEINLVYHKTGIEKRLTKKISTVLDFTKNSKYSGNGLEFPAQTITLPRANRNNYHLLCLATTIQVYKDFYLREGNSGLTTMVKIKEIEEIENYKEVTMQYKVSKFPDFEYQFN